MLSYLETRFDKRWYACCACTPRLVHGRNRRVEQCNKKFPLKIRSKKMSYDLDFEQELVAAAEKIRELQQEVNDEASQQQLERAIYDLHIRTKELYAHLTSW